MLSPTSTSKATSALEKQRELSSFTLLSPPHDLSETKKQTPEAKQAATERQRQRVKENKFVKKISKIIPAAWLGGGGASSSASRGKYKPAPPASGSDDATGGFGGGGEGSAGFSAMPPGAGKRE